VEVGPTGQAPYEGCFSCANPQGLIDKTLLFDIE
jgi:hypothetical protein